jgi:hypothetical protein
MKKKLIAFYAFYGIALIAAIATLIIGTSLFAGWLLGASFITKGFILSVFVKGISITLVSGCLGGLAELSIKEAEKKETIKD